MDKSSYNGLLQEMEDESFMQINEWIMNSYEGIGATLPVSAAFTDHDLQHSSFYDDYDQLQPMIKSTISRPDNQIPNNLPQLKSNIWRSCITEPPTSSPEPQNNFSPSNNSHTAAIAASSFFYPPGPPGQFTLDRSDHQPVWSKDQSTYATHALRTMSASVRTPAAQDHVIAERKRREKVGLKFISLSAVVPGLKKTDKASVLTGAIKYLKHLQERVKTLEDQIKVKQSVESKVLVKKSKLLIDEKFKHMADGLDEELLEIEVRVCDKDVLIKVHCDNKKGVIEKIIGELSMLNLTISNTSVLAFGNSALNITIIARMDVKCCFTVKELATTLCARFYEFRVNK